MPTYYNSNTQQKVTYSSPQPRLEALPQWRVVNTGDDDASDVAVSRAEAEKRSIEEASKSRAQSATKYHEEALEIAAASAKSTDGGPANVTFASTTPDGFPATEGVLARAKGDQQSGALQIGPDPDRHPRTREELEAKAEADSARIAALAPEESSVLNRPGMKPSDAEAAEDAAEDDEALADTPDDSADSPEEVKAPAKSARVADWRTYAIEQHDADPDEVAGMTRDELVARYGQ